MNQKLNFQKPYQNFDKMEAKEKLMNGDCENSEESISDVE